MKIDLLSGDNVEKPSIMGEKNVHPVFLCGPEMQSVRVVGPIDALTDRPEDVRPPQAILLELRETELRICSIPMINRSIRSDEAVRKKHSQ